MADKAHQSSGLNRLESALADVAQRIPGSIVGNYSTASYPAGARLAESRPESKIIVWTLDLYDHQRQVLSTRVANVQFACAADWPEVELDLALVSLHRGMPGELARDLVQTAWLRLRTGGHLAVSTESVREQLIAKDLKVYAAKVNRIASDRVTVYLVEKRSPLKKIRSFESCVVFRDRDNLLQLITRPGVFSHRQLDNGARQLINMLPDSMGGSVLDLGCGSGAVAIAAARRYPEQSVIALDSNARAIDCTRRSAIRNGLNRLHTKLNVDGDLGSDRCFHWVLANPPYFSHHRIAQHFVDTALRLLVPGGVLCLVTKSEKWYRDYLEGRFATLAFAQGPNYVTIRATNKS